MSIFTKLGVSVAAPFNADGTPRQISPQDFQIWMTEVERFIKGLLAGVGGVDLPELIYKYVITGGDANKIIAKPNAEVTAGAGEALFTIDIAQPNTGNVSINGKSLLTSSGNQIVADGLVPGIWLFLDEGANFRLVSDQASQAIMDAAEQAAVAAQEARDIVENLVSDAVSQGNVPIYSTLTSLPSIQIPAGITSIRINGRNSVGDGLGGLFTDTDTGSIDTTTSGDGRTWFRVDKEIKNVKEYGIKADGVTDAGPILQSLLDQSGAIYFPEGEYVINSGPMRLWENTTIYASPRATIYNGNMEAVGFTLFMNGPSDGTAAPAGGYENTKNIKFVGGVYSGKKRRDAGLGNSQFAIAHHENLVFEDVTFDYTSGNTHSIEVNSTRNARFTRCIFKNFNLLGGNPGNREYVNIDISYEGGFPAFGPWDDTPCDNIIFEDCEWYDGDVAVGSHYDGAANTHKNITVRGGVVNNMLSRAFNLVRWENFSFERVDIQGCPTAWRGVSLYNGFISKCFVNGALAGIVNFYSSAFFERTCGIIVEGGIYSQSNAISFGDTDNCRALNNTWLDDSNIIQTAIQFGGLTNGGESAGNKLNGNKAVNPGGLPESGGYLIVDGVYNFLIPNNGVAIWTPPFHAGQGIVFISTAGVAAYARPRGMYFIRVNGNPIIQEVGTFITSGVDISTGTLNGTSGEGGHFTISSDLDGKVYLENRSGSPLTIRASIV